MFGQPRLRCAALVEFEDGPAGSGTWRSFNNAETVRNVCAFHPGMAGTLTVR